MIWLAVSVGCPSGIGPEVSVVAAAALRHDRARVVLVGDFDGIVRAAALRGVDTRRLARIDSPEQLGAVARRAIPVFQPLPTLATSQTRPGIPSRRGGAAQLAWIDAACDLVQRGYAQALVTGPVSKASIARSAGGTRGPAARFLGHTEHLQRRLASNEVVMAFASETFTTSLVTTHLPLSHVPRAVTAEAVASATFWLADLLSKLSPSGARPRIAVASLNPHAGESGLLGLEEESAIVPGMRAARARAKRHSLTCDIAGPVPGETAFRLAARGRYDGVVAMYHDQATIPMKLVGFGEAVNVSLGLPIVRTSVDHGTAYDIAGQGVADARGMASAMALAIRIVEGEGAGDDVNGGTAGNMRRAPPRTRRAPRR